MLLTRLVQVSLAESRRSQDKAADRKSRGFLLHKYFLGWFFKTNKFVLWPHVSLRFLQPLGVMAAYGTFKVQSLQ
jgi:hypothetical protein